MERIAETKKLPIMDSSTMTIRLAKAVVARPTSSRKQTKVTTASAMLPKKHCAAKREILLVCLSIIRSHTASWIQGSERSSHFDGKSANRWQAGQRT